MSAPPTHDARSRGRLRRLVAVLAATVAGASLVVAVPSAPPASAYPTDTVTVTGRGFGHGRGMGQWGSLGYAIDEDRPYTWILDHFYGGTTMGNQPDAPIRVRLIGQDGKALAVTSNAPFTVGSNAFAGGEAARVAWVGAGWTIERGPGCAGPWTMAQAGIDASAQPEARPVADPGDDVDRMIRVCGENVRSYRGSVLTTYADGAQRSVNVVRMEQYLRGVVPRESPASWGDLDGGRGMEALRAQAVAARSYAWSEARYSYARTCDTTSCQVYGGAGLNGARIEHANTDRAISDTAGQVRILDGKVARTEFSSSTGGWTAGGTFPAVPDTGDDVASNPNRSWTATIPVADVEAAYPAIGRLRFLEVTERNGLGADGGRAVSVRITGAKGSTTVKATSFRSTFRLKSDWFSFVVPVLRDPAVGIAARPWAPGYWLASVSGEVLAFGAAEHHGSLLGRPLSQPIVGITPTPSGEGYWLVARDGGVFSFGDARFFGSTGAMRLNQPIVGMAATRTGKGYWLVASDGGIFSFGDARFEGSMGAVPLNQPIVGMAADPDGRGYWLVARDGGIFSFAAVFHGSAGAIALNQPIVGMAADPKGRGYWFVAADGGIFSYGARFHGSTGGRTLAAPVVGMGSTPTGEGYWLAGRESDVYRFGDA